MNRVALPAIIALAGYATSFVPPDPSLTRIAPDRAMPHQRPLAEGFWGAGSSLMLIGPDLIDFMGNCRLRSLGSYPVNVTFGDPLDEDAVYRRFSADPQRRGFLRMVPTMWYGVRPEIPDRFVPNGSAACAGRFYLFTPHYPVVPQGWRLVSSRIERVRVPLRCDYEASGGGGAQFSLIQPQGWRLGDIGLQTNEPYVAMFSGVWDNPLNEWRDPRPATKDEAMTRYSFKPVVWAKVVRAVLADLQTGEHKTTTTPTGWVETAGVFRRNEGSGW